MKGLTLLAQDAPGLFGQFIVRYQLQGGLEIENGLGLVPLFLLGEAAYIMGCSVYRNKARVVLQGGVIDQCGHVGHHFVELACAILFPGQRKGGFGHSTPQGGLWIAFLPIEYDPQVSQGSCEIPLTR